MLKNKFLHGCPRKAAAGFDQAPRIVLTDAPGPEIIGLNDFERGFATALLYECENGQSGQLR